MIETPCFPPPQNLKVRTDDSSPVTKGQPPYLNAAHENLEIISATASLLMFRRPIGRIGIEPADAVGRIGVGVGFL